jgi:phosphopantothenate-cysteine ligase
MADTTHESQTFSAESYFETQPQPPSLVADIEGVHEFIQRQQQANRSVVLVTVRVIITSARIMHPELEPERRDHRTAGAQCVRTSNHPQLHKVTDLMSTKCAASASSIILAPVRAIFLSVIFFFANYHAGTRGATSAEYFLKAGYAVIFMHRQFSLQPFSRHYSHSTNPFLNFLEIDGALPSSSTIDSAFPYSNDPPPATPTPQITVTTAERAKLFSVLRAYKAVHAQGTLHMVSFVTVNEYLWLLRAVSREMSVLGRKAMYYLAAAVSDFFLPQQRLVSDHTLSRQKMLTLPTLSRNIRYNLERAICL